MASCVRGDCFNGVQVAFAGMWKLWGSLIFGEPNGDILLTRECSVACGEEGGTLDSEIKRIKEDIVYVEV